MQKIIACKRRLTIKFNRKTFFSPTSKKKNLFRNYAADTFRAHYYFVRSHEISDWEGNTYAHAHWRIKTSFDQQHTCNILRLPMSPTQ